jgi:hypothetical protein
VRRYFEQTCNNLVRTYLTSTSHTYGTGDSEVTQTGTTTHAKPAGVFWWVYNFNSGGTGGLVYFNPGEDQTKEGIAIKWYKIDYMVQLTGMTPWYLAP